MKEKEQGECILISSDTSSMVIMEMVNEALKMWGDYY